MDTDAQRWPALMDLATAAEYLQLRPATLLRFLGRQDLVAVDLGARLRRWRRADLDELISRLPRQGEAGLHTSIPGTATSIDLALAAVEARSRERRRQHEVRQPGATS